MDEFQDGEIKWAFHNLSQSQSAIVTAALRMLDDNDIQIVGMVFRDEDKEGCFVASVPPERSIKMLTAALKCVIENSNTGVTLEIKNQEPQETVQ